MTKTDPKRRRRAITVAAVLLGAAGVVLAQQSLPDAGGEYMVPQNSWPHEIKGQAGGTTKTMGVLLKEIVDKGLTDLADPAIPEPVKVQIRLAIARAMACGCYDGYIPVDPASPPNPLPPHNQKFGDTPDRGAHLGAKSKAMNAWNAVFPTPPATVNWKTAADELNHGH